MQNSDAGGKPERPKTLRRWLASTSNRTFAVYPVCVAAFEYIWNGGRITFVPWGVVLLAWGYAQYRFGGNYRERPGGGGPGRGVPPARIGGFGH